jgi:hypothetical protein
MHAGHMPKCSRLATVQDAEVLALGLVLVHSSLRTVLKAALPPISSTLHAGQLGSTQHRALPHNQHRHTHPHPPGMRRLPSHP